MIQGYPLVTWQWTNPAHLFSWFTSQLCSYYRAEAPAAIASPQEFWMRQHIEAQASSDSSEFRFFQALSG